MNIKKIVIAGSIAAIACAAQGFQIVSLSPQGEVARVRQVVVKLDDSAVNFGDPKAPAPLSLSCSDAQATAKGSELTGATSYKFNSGGPFVQHIRPYDGSRIDEEQYFTLQLNGPATPASVQAKVWCANPLPPASTVSVKTRNRPACRSDP